MNNWRPESLITLKQDLTNNLSNKPASYLRMILILICIIIIVLSFFVDNPYVLAGMIAYVALP